jgi:hypothetical protein
MAVTGPTDRGVAQLASALAWGARGRKFESSHPDIFKTLSVDNQLVAFWFNAITDASPAFTGLHHQYLIHCFGGRTRVAALLHRCSDRPDRGQQVRLAHRAHMTHPEIPGPDLRKQSGG